MWSVLLALLSISFFTCKEVCDEKYLKITPEHSMCKSPNKMCRMNRPGRPLREKVVQVHNRIRNSIRRFSSDNHFLARNMLKMEWDEELYEMAWNYARQCIEQPDCYKCHQTDRFRVEQNFAVLRFKDTTNTVPTKRMQSLVKSWARELKDYEPEIVKKFEHKEGQRTNWTNIFRATTTKVGCASMSFKTNDPEYLTEIHVCNYGPAKLVEGEEIYEVGEESCTNCLNQDTCDKKYQNLCGDKRPTIRQVIAEETILSEETSMVTEEETILSEETSMATEEETSMVTEEETILSEETSIVTEEETILSEATTMVTEEETILNEETSMVTEEETILSEETSIVTEEETILSEATSMVTEEETILNKETSMVTEEETILSEATSMVTEEETSLEIIEETTPQTTTETSEVTIEETSVIIIDETSLEIIEETTPQTTAETSEVTIEETSVIIIDETSLEIIEETTPQTSKETSVVTIDETAETTEENTGISKIEETTTTVPNMTSCDNKYRKITKEHSMCKARNESCKYKNKPAKPYNLKVKSAEYHNEIRNNIKSKIGKKYKKASNMLMMEFDEELYEIAKSHILQCVGHPDCDLCHQTDRFHTEENFAMKTFQRSEIEEAEPTERFQTVINEWASEMKTYDRDIVYGFQFLGEHFTNWTNILRASTSRVGCASIVFDTEQEDIVKEIYVCIYGPARLEEGEEIYEIGQWCTTCPHNLVCDEEYSRLCGPSSHTESTVSEDLTTEFSTIVQDKTELNVTSSTWGETASKTETAAANTSNIETTASSRSSSETTSTSTVETSPKSFYSKETPHTLWECDFGYRHMENCEAIQQCKEGWMTVHDYYQNYKRIILDEGKSLLLFTKDIYVENGACFTFFYKKTSQIIWATSRSILTGIVVHPERYDKLMLKMIYPVDGWTLASIDIPWKNAFIKVGFAVKVYGGLGGQVIMVKDLVVHNGRCS